MQPLSLDDRSHRVAETKAKSEDMMNYANKLVADSAPRSSITSLRKRSTTGISTQNDSDTEDAERSTRHQVTAQYPSGGGGQVAGLEEMRRKLEELDALRQQLSRSNDKRHRIAILQDEVVAAENRVVELVTALEAVTIKLAGAQDDVEDLHEKERAAKYDLELVERNLPELVQQVEGLNDEENVIRKCLNEAQDALDRTRQVADDTEASMQRILKGTMFDMDGGMTKSPSKGGSSSPSSYAANGNNDTSVRNKSTRLQSTRNRRHEGENEEGVADPLDKIKKEKWNLKADFLDTDQQRMELKLEKETATRHENAPRNNNDVNKVQEDDDLARTSSGHHDVNILLGRIEQASPNFYSHNAIEARQNKMKGDSPTTESASSSPSAATAPPPQPKSSLKENVPNIAVDSDSTTFSAQANIPSHSSTRTSRDGGSTSLRDDSTHRAVAFTFGTAGSRTGSVSSTPRGRSPTELSTTTAAPRIGSSSDIASRKMSLGVAQHTVSRLTEKVAMLERTLERREKRMKDVEAANVATQDRFSKMRVELLMLRRGLALLGTVEEEGDCNQQISTSDAGLPEMSVIAKLQEMASNKEKRLTESYKLADNLSSTFLTGMDSQDHDVLREDVTVDIGPSPSSKRKSISGSKSSSASLTQKGGKSIVHKNSSQYRLLEDLRAEIRFYEAERISLYSRLYGLKENGGKVLPPQVSSVLKSTTISRDGGSKMKKDMSDDIGTYGASLLPPVVPIYLDSTTGEVSVRTTFGSTSGTTATRGVHGSTVPAVSSPLANAVKVRRTPPTGRTAMTSIKTEIESELNAAAAPGGQLHQQVVIDKLRRQLRQSEERFQALRLRYHSTRQILELVEQEALYGCDSYSQGKSNIEEKISAVIGAATKSQKELLERTAASDDAAKRATEELQHAKKQNEALTQTGKILRDELSTTKFRLEDAHKLAANLTTQLRNETRKFPAEELGPLDTVIKRAREREALPNGSAQALQQRLGYTCGDHLLELQEARAIDFSIEKLKEKDEAHDAFQIKLKSDTMSFAEFDVFRKDVAKKRETRKRNTSKRQCSYSELSSPIGEVVLLGKVQSSIVAIANTVRGIFKEYVLCNPGASTSLLTAVQNIGTLVEFWEQLPQNLARAIQQYTDGVHGAILEEFKDVVEMITRNGQLEKDAAVSACEMEYRSRLAGKIKTDNQGCQTDDMDDMPICEIIPITPDGHELVNGDGSSSRLGASQSRKLQSKSQSMSRNSLTARRSSSLIAGGSRSGKAPPSFKKAAATVMKKNVSNMSPATSKPNNNNTLISLLSSNGGASPIATIPSNTNLLSLPPTSRDPFEDASYFDSDEEELYRSHRSMNPNGGVLDVGVGTDMTLEELECVMAGCEAYQLYQDSQQGMVDRSNNTTLSIGPDEAEFEVEQRKLEKKVDELKSHLVEILAQSKQFKHESEVNLAAGVHAEGQLNDREFEIVVLKEELASGSVHEVHKSYQQKDLQIKELQERVDCILDGWGSCGVGRDTIDMLMTTISNLQTQTSQLKEQLSLSLVGTTRIGGAASGFRMGSANPSNTRNAPPRPATGGRPSTPSFPCDLPLRNVHSREGGARRTLYRPSSSSATSRIGNDSESIRPSTASLMLHQNDSSPTPTDEQLLPLSQRGASPDDANTINNYLEIEDHDDPGVLSTSTLVIVDANTLVVEELQSQEEDLNDNDNDGAPKSSSLVKRTNNTPRHNSMPLGSNGTASNKKAALLRRGSYDAGAGVSRVSLLPQQRTSFRKAAVTLTNASSTNNTVAETPFASLKLMRSICPNGSTDTGHHHSIEDIEMVNSFSFHNNANYQHTNNDSSNAVSEEASRSSMPQSSHQLLPRKRSQVTPTEMAASSSVSRAHLPPLLHNVNTPVVPVVGLSSSLRSSKNPTSFNPNFSTRSLSPDNITCGGISPSRVECGPSSSDVFTSALTSAAHHKSQHIDTPMRTPSEIKKQPSAINALATGKHILVVRPSTTTPSPMTAAAQAASVSKLQRHTSSSATVGGAVSRGRLTVPRRRVSITPDFVASTTPKSTSSQRIVIPSIDADSTHARRPSPKSASDLNEAARKVSPTVGGGKPYSRPLVPEPLSPRQGFTLLRETKVSDRPV